MTYTITKEFAFSASHVLVGLPDGHQCGRLHGHNYVVQVQLEATELNQHGFIVDYGDLGPFKEWIDQTLDHRHLNDVTTNNPTAEQLAKWLTAVVRLVVSLPKGVAVSVGVSETPKTWAWHNAPPSGFELERSIRHARALRGERAL